MTDPADLGSRAHPTELDPLWAVTSPHHQVEAQAAPIDAGPMDGPPAGHGRVDTGAPLAARRRRWPGRVAKTLLVLVLVGVVYYGITFFQVWSTGRRDQARTVDALVVLGAAQYDGRPSPQLAARLDHVIELWQQGIAPVIVVTGGNQPGDRFTEAEASAAYLVERGVPAEAIVQESEGRSSWESLEGVAELVQPVGIERVLLVSDPFHSLRVRLIAEELGFEAYTSPTRTGTVNGASARAREAKEAAGIALGRIIGFERLWRLTG